MAMAGRKVGVTRIGAVGSAMALGGALLAMAGSVAAASPPDRHSSARAPLAAITAQPPPGYRVVLLDYGGNSVIGRGSLVRLRPTAPAVTVQLIRPDGRYAGPVVLRPGARRAVMGIRAGASLGRIVLRRGYATVSRTPPARLLDPGRDAIARRGAPIGAGNFGLIRSRDARGENGPGRDLDRDGVPSAFDIDDNGNMVLDNLDASAGPPTAGTQAQRERPGIRVAAAEPPPAGAPPVPAPPPGAGPVPPGSPPVQPPPVAPAGGNRRAYVFSNLKLSLEESLNANAAGISDDEIDGAMKGQLGLAIGVPEGNPVELDCTGLSYCSPGGTATTGPGAGAPEGLGLAFPDAFDLNRNGFGELAASGPSGDFHIWPHATANQIRSGDIFVWRATTGGQVRLIPQTLQFVFATTPALKTVQVNDEAPLSVTYPVAPGGAGTAANPFLVPASGPVRISFNLWRPQRKAIPEAEEPEGWMDIGHLHYQVELPNAPTGPGTPPRPGVLGNCPGFSSTSDSQLVLGRELVDRAGDAPANPANTLGFTTDITGCLEGAGISWGPGESLMVGIEAQDEQSDNAAQNVYFRRR